MSKPSLPSSTSTRTTEMEEPIAAQRMSGDRKEEKTCAGHNDEHGLSVTLKGLGKGRRSLQGDLEVCR